MPSFKLPLNERNAKIAEFIEAAEQLVKVSVQADSVLVKFERDLALFRFMLEGAAGILTQRDWLNLFREIKSTLTGGKIREMSDQVIRIQPLRRHVICTRLSDEEFETVRKAASEQRESISAFVRNAVLSVADKVATEKERRKSRDDIIHIA